MGILITEQGGLVPGLCDPNLVWDLVKGEGRQNSWAMTMVADGQAALPQ